MASHSLIRTILSHASPPPARFAPFQTCRSLARGADFADPHQHLGAGCATAHNVRFSAVRRCRRWVSYGSNFPDIFRPTSDIGRPR
jgi:hypothetical protein